MTFYAFDTETTGTRGDHHEIISFAAKLLDDKLNVIRSLTVHAHPGMMDRAEAMALKVNGYTKEAWDAKGAVTQGDLIQQIQEFNKGIYRAFPLGHNVGFDVSFLEGTFRRFGQEATLNNVLAWFRVDTMSIALLYDLVRRGKAESFYKLSAVAERLGLTQRDWHDAQADVDASIELFKHILDRLTLKEIKAMAPVLPPPETLDVTPPPPGLITLSEPLPPPAPLPAVSRSYSRFLSNDKNDGWVWRNGKHAGKKINEVPWDYIDFMLTRPEADFPWSPEQKEIMRQTRDQLGAEAKWIKVRS